ncbi:cation:proton antiporter [Comamonas composti]|uniref:cation:proton antiporter n=1 Tax=Comamonas composti TaxID=408558 RepID=UPI000414DB13|nr:cation:proton antiporter [Comamonas composti]
MSEMLSFWDPWLRPSAGLATVQWSLLLALATMVGYACQRHAALPKVVGYSLVGGIAGLIGFGANTAWPLQGTGLFLLELGVGIVLFECGGRITLRWFRHNPMVLVQSLAESALTYALAWQALRWLDVAAPVASSLALVAMAASPLVLTRIVSDMRAAGPVTDRGLVLATLSTLYALALGAAQAGMLPRATQGFWALITPVFVVLGVSIAVALVLAALIRLALRFMSPASENTSFLILALISASVPLTSYLGGSAPLAALLGGILLKHFNPRPWAWPRQLGSAASLLTLLMFVMVSTVAAQADWSGPVIGAVAALIVVRLVAKTLGVAAGNVGTGANWKQALWVGCAMAPMSSVALLIASQLVAAAPDLGGQISAMALPTILVMEVLGAAMATAAIYRAGESAMPWRPLSRNANRGDDSES